MRFIAKILLLAVLSAWATGALGSGYAVWEMGIRSSGMGGVMTATADDPTAIFYNPAGLGLLTVPELSADVTFITPWTEFSGVDPNPGYGVTETLDDDVFTLPQLYFTYPVAEGVSVGLGFYTPYGLSVAWKDPDTYSGRYIATFTKLATYFLTPTVGYRPHEKVSLGLGLNFVWSHVELNQHIIQEVSGNSTDMGKVAITGSGDLAFSFNAGVLVDVTEKTRLGINFKSKTDLKMSGDADFTSFITNAPLPSDGPVNTEVPLPMLLSLGIASQASEKLRLEFNFNYIWWSTFEELKLVFPDSPEANKTIKEDYEDSPQYRFGVEYLATPEIILRGGFVRDLSPQPTATTGPVLPDSDRTGISIGGGYRFGNAVVNVYNLFLFFDDREVRDNHEDYNGNYRNYTNLFGLGLHYRF